ncbi:hypothetical protein CASFOL_027006 [Castilleja foliolosa]|uniref:CID domain-containing protein n=1 Tax=Castilleja foliolosa TaxID=1961234 RepID=A0ABD3CKI0_9LAMI
MSCIITMIRIACPLFCVFVQALDMICPDRLGNGTFSELILTDELSKLKSSTQSIKTLSQWYIYHRERAKQVVRTWDKSFKSAQPQQQVYFLYLSNDILQNSRSKGSEFLNEFWKVLPEALWGVYDGGNRDCIKAASRVVGIWEEKKVFGSRGQILRNVILGKKPSPANNVKSSSPIIPIKVVKRDANSLSIKLAVGGLPERILSAMQLVQDEVVDEEEALDKCRDAISCVRKMEKDVGNVSPGGVVDTIKKQENMIQQCISKLEKSEEIRVALVSQLREALQDQESKLEQIRGELTVARGQIGQAASIRLLMTSASCKSPAINQIPMVEPTFTPVPPMSTTTSLPLFINSSTEEESKEAAAAAVAAKLAASTSSAQMLTPILSSLVAEEAPSMRSGLKRQKLSDPDGGGPPPNPAYSNAQQVFASMPPGTTQPISQMNQLQAPFLAPLQAPPPANSSANQATGMQPYGYGAMSFDRPAGPPPQQAQQLQQPTSGGYFRPVGVGFYGQGDQPPTTPPANSSANQAMGMQPYGYGAMAFDRPAGPPPQQAQQLQQPTSGEYFRPGVGFYGQSYHPPTTPPANYSVNQAMGMQPYGYGAMAFDRPAGPPPQQAQQLQQPTSGGYFRPVGVGFYGQSDQPPANSSANQAMGMQPYGYGAMAFDRPAGPPPQQAQQLKQPTSGGYFRPVGVGFYGQSYQPPTTLPIHRQ